VTRVTEEEVARLGDGYDDARAIFERIATQPDYVEFLTLPAYDRLVATSG
jgi:malate synthase